MSGEKTAVQMVLREQEPPEISAAAQFDMLGLAPSQSLMKRNGAGEQAKGRPPGARNKRTLEMVAYLSSQYRSPLESLAIISNSGIDELPERLGCSKLEALQEVRNAATALLPYWHQKMPLAVDVTNRRVVHLNIFDADSPASEEDEIALMDQTIEDKTGT